jgi:hypothetical protein
MTEIRLDTDELKRLAWYMNMEVTGRIQTARKRIAGTMEMVGMDRPDQHGFSSIVGPKILQAAGQFEKPVARLEEAREKLVLAVRYFEEIDATGVGWWQGYRSTCPDWFRNRDLGMLLIMNLTAEDIGSFYRYGNLLSGDSGLILPDLLVFLKREYGRIQPGTPEAKLLLELADITNIKPGTSEAEFYLSMLDINTIQHGTLELDVYLASVNVEAIQVDTPEGGKFVELITIEYGLSFEPQDTGWIKWGGGPKWEMVTAAKAVVILGRKFGDELDIKGSKAFKTVYGVDAEHPMKLSWNPKDEICNGRGGRCTSRRLMVFATMSGGGSQDDQKGINHVIHELGHAFSNYWVVDGKWLTEKPDNVLNAVAEPLRSHLKSDYGFFKHGAGCGTITTWRQHPPSESEPNPPAGEYFADMFIGWVYDAWAPPSNLPEDIQIAAERKAWMDDHMPNWIRETAVLPK